MNGKPRKFPRQKKALSLARDCRNTYGENTKAARKAIPLRKAIENRRIRHENNQALSQADRLDEADLDLVESSARQNVARLGGWKKASDEPLGVVIERAYKAREQRAGRKTRARFNYTNDS
ncbi:hypothetical protein [Sphingomonas sp.]|uniref:hypothetical protein n=1 Tax=Sphingomonas sp. TaxID=28214 RepID=UPI002ED7B1AF